MSSSEQWKPDPDLVFVYGTLRPALARGEPAGLIAGLEWTGPATVRGILYDLGDYPGLVAGDAVVHGDLLRLASPDQLEAFDRYEECQGARPLYRRERWPASRPDGSIVQAWVYVFARSITSAAIIPGGDYASRNPGPSPLLP